MLRSTQRILGLAPAVAKPDWWCDVTITLEKLRIYYDSECGCETKTVTMGLVLPNGNRLSVSELSIETTLKQARVMASNIFHMAWDPRHEIERVVSKPYSKKKFGTLRHTPRVDWWMDVIITIDHSETYVDHETNNRIDCVMVHLHLPNGNKKPVGKFLESTSLNQIRCVSAELFKSSWNCRTKSEIHKHCQ